MSTEEDLSGAGPQIPISRGRSLAMAVKIDQTRKMVSIEESEMVTRKIRLISARVLNQRTPMLLRVTTSTLWICPSITRPM